MKWFDRWFMKKSKWAWENKHLLNEDDSDGPMLASSVNKVSRTADIETERGLNIQVHSAIGGRIVSFRHYDHKADRHYNKTYVIPEDMDFERELGKCITLESMR
jgi:hypothetical protein